MPFPEDVLNTKVEIAIDGIWTDITDYVYTEKIQIYRGADDETADTSPTRCRLRLNNIDGRFSPRNPNSPYYGKLGRNTPILVSVMEGEPFLDVPGVGRARTSSFACPDNVDVRVDAQIFNWNQQSGNIELAACYDSAIPHGWIFQIDDGRLNVLWAGTGTWRFSATNPVTVPPSGRVVVRFVADYAAGLFHFYQGPTVDGPWTSLGGVGYGDGDQMLGATTDLSAGSTFSGLDWSDPNGRYYRLQVRDGQNGPVVADIDFGAQTVGDTSFPDAVGNTWEPINGSKINNQYNRFRGEVSSWPTRWTTGGFDAWEDIQAYSLMRRYGQGVEPLRSPLMQSISKRPTLVAYWPMEDPDGTTGGLSPATPDTRRMSVDGEYILSTHAGPPGSDALPSFTGGSNWHGEVNGHRFERVGSWQVQGLFNFQQLSTTPRNFMILQTSGKVREWRLFVSQSAIQVIGYSWQVGGVDGAVVLVETVNKVIAWTYNPGDGDDLTPGATVNHWQKWQFSCVQNGGTFQWSIASALVDPPDGAAYTEPVAVTGDIGWVDSVMSPPEVHDEIGGLSVGHIAVYYGDDISIFDEAELGYRGETARERAVRLAEENGENLVYLGNYNDSLEMAEQRPDRLLDQLRECAQSDRGIFGDNRDWSESAFRFVGRSALYNQTPVLVLDYGELRAPLDPTDDDQYLRNRVTAQKERGGFVTAEKTEGVNSTSDVGVYDTTVSVNVELESMLPDIAGWEVHLGTWNEERYPTVLLMLHATPHLIRDALKIDQGTRILIRNARSPERPWIPPGDIELVVRGYNEVLHNFEWELELQCVPAKPWDVPVLQGEATDASPISTDHVDTDGTALTSAVDADDTIFPVYVSDGPTWTDEAVDYPFDLSVGGEVVRAVAPGGLVNTNAFFDTDTAGWTPVTATLEWSDEVVHPDPNARGSLKIVPTGASLTQAFGPPTAGWSPGGRIVTSAWVWSPAGESDVRIGAEVRTAGGASLVFYSGPATVIPAQQWTYLEAEFDVPATGEVALNRIRVANTPVNPLYVWGARICRPVADWANDTFNRTVASGWGEMDSGDVWATTGGSTSDYGVSSGYGQHLVATDGTSRRSTITLPSQDFDLQVDVAVSAIATGGSLYGGLMGRHTDANNMYHARVEFTTGSRINLSIIKRVAATETTVASMTRELPYTVGGFIRLRFKAEGSTLKAKAWVPGQAESSAWHLTATDTSLTTGNVGVRSIKFAGNTNVNPVVRYDNFRVLNPQVLAVERSRNDIVKSHAAGADVRLANPAIASL